MRMATLHLAVMANEVCTLIGDLDLGLRIVRSGQAVSHESIVDAWPMHREMRLTLPAMHDRRVTTTRHRPWLPNYGAEYVQLSTFCVAENPPVPPVKPI